MTYPPEIQPIIWQGLAQGVGRYEANQVQREAGDCNLKEAASRDDDSKGLPLPRDQLGDILQVEVEIRAD